MSMDDQGKAVLAKIKEAADKAHITIQAYEAASAAYLKMAEIPLVGHPLGLAAAYSVLKFFDETQPKPGERIVPKQDLEEFLSRKAKG